jgi:hypothetical protein
VNDLLIYAVMLDSLIVWHIHVKFVIMLTELKKVLSQELKCLCSKTTTVLSEGTIAITVDMSFLHFYCIRKK